MRFKRKVRIGVMRERMNGEGVEGAFGSGFGRRSEDQSFMLSLGTMLWLSAIVDAEKYQ